MYVFAVCVLSPRCDRLMGDSSGEAEAWANAGHHSCMCNAQLLRIYRLHNIVSVRCGRSQCHSLPSHNSTKVQNPRRKMQVALLAEPKTPPESSVFI